MLVQTVDGSIFLEMSKLKTTHQDAVECFPVAVTYEPNPDNGRSCFPLVNVNIYPIQEKDKPVREIFQAYYSYFDFPECYQKLVDLGIINDKI